jgi:hypothetical protein
MYIFFSFLFPPPRTQEGKSRDFGGRVMSEGDCGWSCSIRGDDDDDEKESGPGSRVCGSYSSEEPGVPLYSIWRWEREGGRKEGLVRVLYIHFVVFFLLFSPPFLLLLLLLLLRLCFFSAVASSHGRIQARMREAKLDEAHWLRLRGGRRVG